MSKRFAILENDVVVNLAIAEEEQYLALVLPEGQSFAEETGATGPAILGKRYHSGLNKFEQVCLHSKWSWDESSFEWVSPLPYPTDGGKYYWSDDDDSWVELVFPVDGVIQVKETAE